MSEQIDPEWHRIDLFRVIRAAGRSDREKSRAAAEYVADQFKLLFDRDECICPKCGLRHGGRSVAGPGF